MGLEWEDSIEQDGQADVTSQAAATVTEVHICSNVIVHAPFHLTAYSGGYALLPLLCLGKNSNQDG
jgi:hypothetical protein